MIDLNSPISPWVACGQDINALRFKHVRYFKPPLKNERSIRQNQIMCGVPLHSTDSHYLRHILNREAEYVSVQKETETE